MFLPAWSHALASRSWRVAESCPSLPPHLVSRGMTFSVVEGDLPRVEGSGWALSREGNEAIPGIIFKLSVSGEEVCTAKVLGRCGFPGAYGQLLMDAHLPLRSPRTLELSSIHTVPPYRRLGCATALMDAMEEWLTSVYSRNDVEVMYLHDYSDRPGFYASRGWRAALPSCDTMLSKRLWSSAPIGFGDYVHFALDPARHLASDRFSARDEGRAIACCILVAVVFFDGFDVGA